VHLRDVGADPGAQGQAVGVEADLVELGIALAQLAVQAGGAGQLLDVGALPDPVQAEVS